MGNWQREAARFCPDLRSLVLHGKDRHEMLAEGRRILLFSQFTSMLTLIEQFSSGAVPLFLISLKAGEERILGLQEHKAALAESMYSASVARKQPLFTESDLAELLKPLSV